MSTLTVITSQSLEYCRIMVEATRDIRRRVQLSPALIMVERNVERNVIKSETSHGGISANSVVSG